MKTIFDTNTYVLEIEKSKFIGVVFHINSVDEFKEKLKQINKEYPKATHYCYGYCFDNYKKSNDDGEPSGTAGMPILETIINNNINNVGVVIIRYFGGIKLGAGGLTRAYRQASDKLIKSSLIKEIINTNSYLLKYDYIYNTYIEKFLKENQITTLSIEYNILIERKIATKLDINELVNITNGTISIIDDGMIEIIKDSK